MVIRTEHESYILDAHHDRQGPKDKRHDAIDVHFRQGDAMITVKAFLESVEGACPDVAKHHTQCGNGQSDGLEGKSIGFRVGGGKIKFIEKSDIQN